MEILRIVVIVGGFLLLPSAAVIGGLFMLARARALAIRLIGLVLLVVGGVLLGTVALGLAGAFAEPPFRFLVVLWLGAFVAAALLFWAWMLADCALNEAENSTEKLTWVLIILFANVVGAAIYYAGRRPRLEDER